MTAYLNIGKCGICSSEIDTITESQLTSRRVFDGNLKRILVCHDCWEIIKNNPKEILCNLDGCRVLKEPDSKYCFRHDESSVLEMPKIPKLE